MQGRLDGYTYSDLVISVRILSLFHNNCVFPILVLKLGEFI